MGQLGSVAHHHGHSNRMHHHRRTVFGIGVDAPLDQRTSVRFKLPHGLLQLHRDIVSIVACGPYY
eukprot:10366563-Heterocapsa_arctica.AAC.1